MAGLTIFHLEKEEEGVCCIIGLIRMYIQMLDTFRMKQTNM